MIYPQIAVTSTKQLLGLNIAGNANVGQGQYARNGTRQITVTNNNVGAGTVYVQLVPSGTASTLTTSVYTFQVPAQPNPYVYVLTPAQWSQFSPDGFDIWVISNTTAQINVQTQPF